MNESEIDITSDKIGKFNSRVDCSLKLKIPTSSALIKNQVDDVKNIKKWETTNQSDMNNKDYFGTHGFATSSIKRNSFLVKKQIEI